MFKIRGCSIGVEGARMLSEALKTNTRLTELYMRRDDENTQEEK